MLFLLHLVALLFEVGRFLHRHAEYVQERFNARFPPISDDEFIWRCGPGVNRDVALRVRRIVSEHLGIEYDQIYPEQKLVEDLDCC